MKFGAKSRFRFSPFSSFSLLFLALPLPIFWWGWFAWWAALPATVALVWWFWIANPKHCSVGIANPDERRALVWWFWVNQSKINNHNRTGSRSGAPPAQISNHNRTGGPAPITNLKSQITFITLAFAWTYLSGVGDFRPQQFDYFKHNLIFNNLVRFDWPVRYADGTYLCYYLAYYLPPALLAKLIGSVSMVHWYVFGWTWWGLTLLFGQLHRLGGWGFVGLFMFFNSPESILLVYEGLKSPLPLAANLADLWNNDHTTEFIFMSGGLTYPSHVESLSAVPQHAIGGWLATGLLLEKITKNDFLTKTHPLYLLGICAILLYWSPFVALGFCPFVVWYFGKVFIDSTLKAPRFRNLSFASNLSPLTFHLSTLTFPLFTLTFLTLPVLIYYAGHLPLHDTNNWLMAFLSTPHQYLLLATFLVLEVVVWGVLLGLLEKKYQILGKNWSFVVVALGILWVLPFYRYGHFNDLARRACVPATVVLCWAIFQFLSKIKFNLTQNKTLALLWICVLLGGVLPLKHTLRWFMAHPYAAVVDKRIVDLTPHTIHYLNQYHIGEFDAVSQYLGRGEAVYSRFWAADSSQIRIKPQKH